MALPKGRADSYGIKKGSMHLSAGPIFILSDNCASKSICNDSSWFIEGTVKASTEGRFQGCEAGGGIDVTVPQSRSY